MKNAMEQLSVCRDIPVAGMHGLQRQAAPEKPKPAWSLHRCASCPCFGASGPREVLPIPCLYLPKTQSAVLHQDHYRHPLCIKSPEKVSNNCRPYYRGEPLMSPDKNKSTMMQHISNVCAPCCSPGCGSCCGPCCRSLPAPCNTPPRCIQYMTGYYYYPYGFWFCGPYHVTGTCVPGGPVCPGGPCGPGGSCSCGPCGSCSPGCGCVCGVLNSLAVMPTPDQSSTNQTSTINLMPSEQAMNMLDVTKIKLPFDMSSLPMNCLPLYASAKGGGRNQCPLPGGPCGPCGVCGPCGPCCGGCGPGCPPCCCGGKGCCGPCGPKGPFGPCGPCFPGVGCSSTGFGCCGPSSQCCVGPGCCCTGCCNGMCVGPCGGCGPCCGGGCGPCCGGCGPCCGGCGPCCGGCGPCGGGCGCGCGCGPCCGPCVPLAAPPCSCGSCGCGPCSCGPCGCGSCLPFGCGACCGVGCPPSPTGLCPPIGPSPPQPSTTGQWSGPCVNCKCTRPIPVSENHLGQSAGSAPFTQCCIALATDKVDVGELCGCATCSSPVSSEEVEAGLSPVPPKKAVNTVQPLNRPGSNLTVFHRHPGYNETKQLTDRPKPLVNTILTCYQSTLTAISSLEAAKAIDGSMESKRVWLDVEKPAKTQNVHATYDETFPTSKPTYDKPRYVPADVERELPSFPNCFTYLNVHPRCASKPHCGSKPHDCKVPTSSDSGICGARRPWQITCDGL